MRSIDVHAHMSPQALWKAMETGGDWYGVSYQTGEQGEQQARQGRPLDPHATDKSSYSPEERAEDMRVKMRFSLEERVKDMDAMGVDVHVVSISPPLFAYHLESAPAIQRAREVNDEIAGMTTAWPQRFAGLATLPLPDVAASIAETERTVGRLGFKGVEIDTAIHGRNWDEPEFFPLFKVAEQLGALLFFHPAHPMVQQRIDRYHLRNTIGNPLEDALIAGTLICSGILDRCPDLKVCIAHGGGPACFLMGRMDRAWQVRSETRSQIDRPPSSYLRRIYYDCLTHSEAALRFMIDTIGADRIVLGSDWPYDMGFDSPVEWINGLESLKQNEKDMILGGNLEKLLGM